MAFFSRMLLADAIDDNAGTEEPASNEQVHAVAIVIELGVLAVALVLGRLLERKNVTWIGEAGVALLLGVVVGLLIKALQLGDSYKEAMSFKGDIFFFVLLPTIMFDAGYSLDAKPFIANLGSICMFAFVGTTISTFIIGLMMYCFGLWGWCYQMDALYNLSFGALISATDPVTVLAVFQRLNADTDLYINVFGESVLNDAVAMVLYNTITAFLGKTITAGLVFKGIGMFIGIFLGSVVVGLALGAAAALIFRTQFFASESGSTFETGLVMIFAYASYVLADVLYLSGIVSVVFCGMMMAAYVKPNLSETAEVRVHSLLKVLAGLFELFVFVYIGLTLFVSAERYDVWKYTLLCLLTLAISRYCNIYVCGPIVNYLRLEHHYLTHPQMFVMWWSGLRGAMAFALSIQAAEQYGDAGQVMKTCTFYLIVVTVLINGGSCGFLLDRYNLRQGGGKEGASKYADRDENYDPGRRSGAEASDAPDGLQPSKSMWARHVGSLRRFNNGGLQEKLSYLHNKYLARWLIAPNKLHGHGHGGLPSSETQSLVPRDLPASTSTTGIKPSDLFSTPAAPAVLPEPATLKPTPSMSYADELMQQAVQNTSASATAPPPAATADQPAISTRLIIGAPVNDSPAYRAASSSGLAAPRSNTGSVSGARSFFNLGPSEPSIATRAADLPSPSGILDRLLPIANFGYAFGLKKAPAPSAPAAPAAADQE